MTVCVTLTGSAFLWPKSGWFKRSATFLFFFLFPSSLKRSPAIHAICSTFLLKRNTKERFRVKRLEANVLLTQWTFTNLYWERLPGNEYFNRGSWGEAFGEKDFFQGECQAEGKGSGRNMKKSRMLVGKFEWSLWRRPIWVWVELHLTRCPGKDLVLVKRNGDRRKSSLKTEISVLLLLFFSS